MRYQQRAGITSGALFRRIRKDDHIQSERLTDFSARRIIQKRASDAGVEGFIAGRSLRFGSAVALVQAGASVVEMHIAGRWKSSQMPAHYAKSELAERGAIAKYKEKQQSKAYRTDMLLLPTLVHSQALCILYYIVVRFVFVPCSVPIEIYLSASHTLHVSQPNTT